MLRLGLRLEDPAMIEKPEPTNAVPTDAPRAAHWEKPAFEVISLACEISAYAPDDGGPLF
jgi:hypothetical protein